MRKKQKLQIILFPLLENWNDELKHQIDYQQQQLQAQQNIIDQLNQFCAQLQPPALHPRNQLPRGTQTKGGWSCWNREHEKGMS